jgi:glucan endo-1,3-alpha-glucosidase
LQDDHALQDVQRALGLGVSAFALNVGTCPESWCVPAIQSLFAATEGTDFKIFFSLDLYSQPDPYAFVDLINEYFAHPNYYRGGPDSAPMLSTFLDAGWGPDGWAEFLAALGTKPYFVPMFDQAQGYYTDPESFWAAWTDVLDGCFSWEQSWPGRSESHANVTWDADASVMAVTHSLGKTYMTGLSSLQYKHFQGQHWFRAGDVVLPERMAQILSLADSRPDIVQVQTWNDAGESHYIGTLWSEGLTPEILEYANQDEHPHEGWQSLVASFIRAFKDGADASGMRPQDGSDVTGALWHHEYLTSSGCANAPDGYGAALDAVNWALVVGEGIEGLVVQVWSGGELILKEPLSVGLNYRSTPNVKTGEQVVEVIDAQGNIVAQGGQATKGISAQDTSGICNLNFQVAGLSGAVY